MPPHIRRRLVYLLRPQGHPNTYPREAMYDPITHLREHFPELRRHTSEEHPSGLSAVDGVQLLTAELLLFTGVGSALESLRRSRETQPTDGTSISSALRRPTRFGPVLLGAAAAAAHVVYAFRPTERTRLATRTFDLAVAGIGLLSLADEIAQARRDGGVPAASPAALASAGLLGILIDRSETRQAAERERLERRASVVERLVPRRRSRLDRIVVHV